METFRCISQPGMPPANMVLNTHIYPYRIFRHNHFATSGPTGKLPGDDCMNPDNKNKSSADGESAALIQEALQHYQAGKLELTRETCQRILRREHRPDAILILAKIAHEQRQFESAVEHYQQFLKIVPDHAQTHYHLGTVMEQVGLPDDAIGHYRKSLTIAADDPQVHGRLADACGERGRWTEAIESYRQVLAALPQDVGTMIKLGQALSEARLVPEAIQIYEQAMALLPDNALVHRRLGAACLVMGQLARACACFEQALALQPDYFAVKIDLALALRQMGRAEEAVEPLKDVLLFKPDDEEARVNLALTLKQLGQTGSAMEELDRLLTRRPSCGRAWYHLSMIRPQQELIPAVEKIINIPELPDEDAMYCHFALGNFMDSGKMYDQAFGHYLKANERHRKTLTYRADENTEYADRLIRVFSKDFFDVRQNFGSSSQVPVFVVGMPRSGTTLVEQIISSHSAIHGAGEIRACPAINYTIAHQLKHQRPDPECIALLDKTMGADYAEQYLHELTSHCSTAARITDKEPGNFFRIGLIKTLFPNAYIINCQRSPLDNCISAFFHCFTAFQASFELSELGHFYRDHQRLMSHWHALFPDQILTVQYEELVRDQERVSSQMIDYLDLEWDEKCLEFHDNKRNVMTPSNMQVRRPMYQDSIDRWKCYEKHLHPLIEVLNS